MGTESKENIPQETPGDRWARFYALLRLKVVSLRRLWCLTKKQVPTNGEEGVQSNSREIEAVKDILFPAIGLFVFYVGHDALQEQMFRFEGFEFGWFMTLAEVTIMLLGAMMTEGVSLRCLPGGTQSTVTTALIGICIALSHGFGNTALRYTAYPLKVAFKSCKLVPTMALGVFLTGRRHNTSEYIAAVVMCAGLFMLTMAQTAGKDVHKGELSTAYLGPILLTVATCLDSVVPNLQERMLQNAKVRTVDLIFVSNLFVVGILLCYTLVSGELQAGLDYCIANLRVLQVLTLQSACAYCGLRCYLKVVREHGGVSGVLLTNARKIVTIVLSFVLFAKPCNFQHICGMWLIFAGVYLGYFSKKKGTKRRRKKQAEQESNGEQTDSHEHVV